MSAVTPSQKIYRNNNNILIVMFLYSYRLYALFCILCFHCANWHSPATLTQLFRAFSSVVRQMPGYNSQRLGTARTLPD
jgi:hypothetical protein